VLKAGFFWLNATTQMLQPEPATSICLQSSYCPGGVVAGAGIISCNTVATGLWTKGLGAKNATQCGEGHG
jgi:hypothetical protein